MTPVTNRDMIRAGMRLPGVSLRWLLGGVTVLASLVFVVSVASLTRLIRLSSDQREGRARDLVQRELASWAAEPDPVAAPARFTALGIRGGIAAPAPGAASVAIQTGISPTVDGEIGALAATAPADRASVVTIRGEGGTTFLGARRRADGRTVWAVYRVAAPRFLGMWRTTVAVLTVATALLGAIAIAAVVGATRGARALKRSLGQLKHDLSAPVARPALAELASVADDVASLARTLADAERDRERLAAELRHSERLAALGRVVAGFAHEVRNPLASLKLRVDGVRGGDVGPEVIAELDAVEEEIQRLDRLVTDFLVVSGRRLGPRVACDLGELARRRAELFGPVAKERGVAVDVGGSARAVVDPDACARAVDNLVKNAVEASPEGARVRVRVERRDESAAVVVEDDGAGVPEDRAHELFEPFFTTKPDGTGLGLAVSRAIAVASGGRLSYRREGGVTRFELIVPGAGADA